MRSTRLFLLVATLVVAMAVPVSGAQARPEWEIDREQVAGKVADLERDDVTTLSGELAGAAWIAQVPDDWNGELLVWAHGYRGEFEDAPTLTVSEPANHEWLLDNGYAWTASSYRRNSYDPGIGMLDTKLLTKHIQSRIGRAEQVYLAGVSMGGHVTAAAIERFPNLYDGALPACGVLGDVELFDYFLDYNLGAAAFAGFDADDLEYPDEDWLGDEVPVIKDALSDTDDLAAWAASGTPLSGGVDNLNEQGEQFKDFVEVGTGGERGAIFDIGWDYWHLLAQGTGDFFFALGEGDGTIAGRKGIVGQNSDTDYAAEYGEVGAAIDDEVLRVRGANRVRKAKGQKPAPIIQGTPSVPVLTMHTIGDLFVPLEMEQIYAEEVAANGRSDLLVQRAIRDVGHCTFTDAEWATAYADLFAWVTEGDRPAGEDLTDLGPFDWVTLGCEFTQSIDPPPAAVRAFDDPCS